MTDQERQQYLQAVREGQISLTGIERSLAQDLDAAAKLYDDKQQRLATITKLAENLRADMLTLGGQIMAISKALCQAEEERRKALPSMPAMSLDELAGKLGADKVEFVPNK